MDYQIVLATNNAHKLQEVRQILSPFGIEVFSLNDLNLHPEDVDENAPDYKGNALIKAKSVQKLTKLPIIADDSGLEVEAMDNKPGIHSARYASECGGHPNAINNILAIVSKAGNRKARFVCDIIALNIEEEPLLFEGIAPGQIADSPYGDGGFGYDPIFVPEESDKTFAELPQEVKNKLSHRGRALHKLIEYLINKKLIRR